MRKKLLTLLLLPFLAASCSGDKENSDPQPNTTPKEYQVTYQVTAVNYNQARIIYRDNTGTLITDENVALPKTYTFKRTMKSADIVSVGAFPKDGDAAANVTCAIQLDGKTVDTKSGPGPNPQPVASYILP
ncbi:MULTISPECIES: hypothetical protein [Hymenobacter]|uniref:Uncharacterized protein n=1 Tax=Hymenobacter mucosus TaxID=1411120 RepID=A0A239AZR7_9BACT|nr:MULTISPECIES: hypothetical protein [Hymenobacter]MDF7815537.1 hypothetical protein [Hymenobacter sp. YC55]SNS00488.1 hypothetical protein SAMN06269173_11634 [Hymenobacter mucosus]